MLQNELKCTYKRLVGQKNFRGRNPGTPASEGVGGVCGGEEKIVPLHRRLVPPLAEISGYGPADEQSEPHIKDVRPHLCAI